MNNFILTHAVGRFATRVYQTKTKSAICHLKTGKRQLKRLRDIKCKSSGIGARFKMEPVLWLPGFFYGYLAKKVL